MKTIKYISLLGVFFLTGGCSDFLDKKPLGIETVESLYSTEAGLDQALNVAYAHLRSYDMSKTVFQAITEITSDDTDPGSEQSDGLVPKLEMLNNFTYSLTDEHVYFWYSTNYAGINRCNQVIANVENSPTPLEKRVYVTAQAKFLRAYYFFNLVRAYGDIPKVDYWVTSPKDYTRLPKSSEAEIYNLIIDDLLSIEETIHTRAQLIQENEIERVSREAVQALLAKAYLFIQDYPNARLYAKKVIDSPELSLFPDFQKLFWPDGTNCSEAIFCGQYKFAPHRNGFEYANHWIDFMGVRENARGWGFIAPTLDLYNAYEPHDPRRDITIFSAPRDRVEFDDEPISWAHSMYPRANGKTLMPKRYYNQNYVFFADINPHYIRLADVILIYAESCNELGNTDEALRAVEQIRFRARGNRDYDPLEAPLTRIEERDKEKLRHLIWHERRLELALENHRFFDLMRYEKVEPGIAERVMHAHGKTNFSYRRHGRFPIPETEVLITEGTVEQNEAWN